MNIKMSYSTHYMRLVLLMAIAVIFHACIDNKYDLDKDLSLEVNVGGKNLAIPLGSTNNIYLDSLVDAKDGDVLNFLENGDFAFTKIDSLDIKIPKIDPVNITVKGLDVDPISVTVNNTQLAENFDLGDFNQNISLGTDNIELSIAGMEPIVIDAFEKSPVEGTAGTPVPVGTSIHMEGNKDFDFSFTKTDEINNIEKVYFGPTTKGTRAAVTIKIPEIIEATQHSITNFIVTLPSGFVLAQDPESDAGSVNGNQFTVTNYNPGHQKEVEFSFYIKEMSGNFADDGTNLVFSGSAIYKIDYKVDAGQFTHTGKPEIKLDMTMPIALKSADVETNDIVVNVAEQQININSNINDIPEEINKVNKIYFKPSANQISIQISALELPVGLSGEHLQLKFPASFHFAATDGLAAGNVLKISPADVTNGANKTLHLTSIDVNQNVQNQSITLSENVVLQTATLQLDGTPSVNTTKLENLSGKAIEVTISGDNLEISDANVTTKGITINVDPAKANMDISEETPKELISVNNVNFKQNPKVKLHLAFSGLPTSISKMRFKDYTITFPDFIVFEDNDIQNHQLVLNEEFEVARGFSRTLTIQKFNFGNDNPIVEEHIVINQDIDLSGDLYVGESEVNSNELKNILISPTLTIDPMELAVVSGKINPDIDPEHETIDIGDIPDFLKDESVVIDIQHPVITVNAANTVGVPVKADLRMEPKVNGKVITDGVVNASIDVAPAETLGTRTWSNFWISDTREGMPSTYEYVETPNLPNLIRKIPDSIAIVMNAVADPDAIHTIDLTVPEYKLQVKYNVSVPLKLGRDLTIVYKDTLDDFHKDIEDYIDYVTEVLVYADAENTIPLEMECGADAIDVNKNVLRGITVSAPQKIQAAGWDPQIGKTSLTKTTFSLTLKETVKGELSKIDGLVFKVSGKANSTVAGATLKRDQYLKLSAKMKVPGGINVDLDDL